MDISRTAFGGFFSYFVQIKFIFDGEFNLVRARSDSTERFGPFTDWSLSRVLAFFVNQLTAQPSLFYNAAKLLVDVRADFVFEL